MKTLLLTGALAVLLGTAAMAPADPARFASPEEAVAALIAALEAGSETAVLDVFGPENADIVSTGNAEEDRQIWGDFLRDAHRVNRIERDGEDRAILHAGRDFWPFPAPLVRTDGTWSFDAEAAREEVLMRRIGRNELAVIEILRRAPEIQRTYRETDHDGDGVMEFAAAILSSPGARDGLYWPETPGAAPSPFDDVIARASFDGYSENGEDRDPEPFEGYYFRILQAQGDVAPGGAYSYMVAGNMVAGHALVAYPAAYGDTGVMSFLVAEAGIVYEADLGEETLARAQEIDAFDPTEEWVPVQD
ncbi:DUF2950 domain-containing protein [Tropicimonas sediminicola]|uniref:DUF2950 domain-containing protein n=1 Tax=Tropicimonas sediminicola TaxID=1031541 RepID=A0A239LPD6_9RHOB|nr:DUF2950 domain-containing protein [Tropicimonas sediminicola]SNT31504.1 Protein of unknown function [Tropicimonas sediminicola]